MITDRTRALRNAMLLAEVPDVEVHELERLVRTVDAAEAQTLAVRGESSPGLVLVDAGALEVLLDAAPICSLAPGSLFSEDSLLSAAPAPATLRASVRSTVGVLERRAVERELARLPCVRAALELAYRRRVLARRLFQIDLFAELSQPARLRVAERFEVVDVPGGTTLAREGERDDALLILREGEAQLEIAPFEPGAPVELAPLRAGDYLGDVQLLSDQPHTATVRAPWDVRVMRLDRRGLHEALAGFPGELELMQAALRRRAESLM